MYDGYDFRAPAPIKETKREKRLRMKRERERGTAYLAHRMRIITEAYTVPLTEIFCKNVIRRSIPECDKILKEIKRESLSINTPRVLTLSEYGTVKDQTERAGPRLSTPFYRSTKHAAWKVYRYHHPMITEDPAAQERRPSLHFKQPQSTYSGYLDMLSHAMISTTQKEAKMQGRSRTGSFFILSPQEKREFRKRLEEKLLREETAGDDFKPRSLDLYPLAKVASNLAERKLAEKEAQTGKHVSFKGKGLPEYLRRSATSVGKSSSSAGKSSSYAGKSSSSGSGLAPSLSSQAEKAPKAGSDRRGLSDQDTTTETDTVTEPDTATELESLTETVTDDHDQPTDDDQPTE